MADDGEPATLAWLRSHVSRFANGDPHARRRRLVEEELARIPLSLVRAQAAAGASAVVALAGALGVDHVADAGETVVVELNGRTAFGAGLRPCPGEAYARAVVAGALDTVRPWTTGGESSPS